MFFSDNNGHNLFILFFYLIEDQILVDNGNKPTRNIVKYYLFKYILLIRIYIIYKVFESLKLVFTRNRPKV